MQGAWLLLISLGVFFIACIILYAVYVALRLKNDHGVIEPFSLNRWFILTTVILIGVSTLMNLAVSAVKREARVDLLRYLVLAFILSLVFFGIQSLCMADLVDKFTGDSSVGRTLHGLTFVLAFLHALHVFGGLIASGLVLVGAWKGKYDHESYFPIRFSALYWHFLDVVWVLMIIAFSMAARLSK
ncbi:MAG: cytochrome c oxidase subunit 3 [Pirellulales bacterium]